jgi:autotransporter-associated beta strand protein
MSRITRFASLYIVLLYTAITSLSAASFTWTGAGTGSSLGVFADKKNWGNAAFPVSGDTGVFTATVGNSSTPTISAAAVIGDVVFNSGAASFNISGASSLTINANGATAGEGINNASGNSEIFSVATLTVGANQTWNNNGSLTASGTTLALGTHNLTVSGSGSTIINNVLTGSGTLSESGTGTLSLNANSPSFSGGVTVSSGSVNVNSSGAFGTGPINLNGGTANLNVNVSPTGAITLGGGTLNQGTTTSTFGNLLVTQNSALQLGGSGTITFANADQSGGVLSISNWQGPAYDPNTVSTGANAGTSMIFVSAAPTAAFLANVQFNGPVNSYPQGASWVNTANGTGELVPVPEPQVYAALFGLGLLGFAIARRRLFAAA